MTRRPLLLTLLTPRHGTRSTAEQLSPLQRWYRMLSRALVKYLNGRQLQAPAALLAPA
jgi:hypothetical protein